MSFRGDRVEPPDPRHALEFVLSSVVKLDARPGDEHRQSARYEYLTRSCLIQDAGGDVDADPPDVLSAEFDLAGVQSGTDRDAKRIKSSSHRECAPDGPSGTVKGG